MRGDEEPQEDVFSYVPLEKRIPKDHPLRAVRAMTDRILKELSPRFTAIYSRVGRPSIPPEQLLRALLLQCLYSVRSERQLMEQLDYNLLFRWFVGLSTSAEVWDATVFTKNRERLLEGDIARAFFEKVRELAETQQLVSNEHFTVDGTVIEAWAGQKSFKKTGTSSSKPPDDPGNPTIDFHGEKRGNATHASTTDPEAKLFRRTRGSESKLCYLGHVLMENRNGLVHDARVTEANGHAERDAALAMLARVRSGRRVTLAGDKGYDTRPFVADVRFLKATPHVAQNTSGRSSAIDGRTTRHPGYAESQRKRKRVEEIFGWLKTVSLMRKTRHRGARRVGWMFTFALAVYNLVRIRNLTAAPA